jgi:putative addiction module killer protein
MNTINQTHEFAAWLRGLADNKGRARIAARINAAASGNFGDAKAVGDGVSEMRIDFGPGYRVYFTRVGSIVYVLLCGGDKSSQKADIAKAKNLAKGLKP